MQLFFIAMQQVNTDTKLLTTAMQLVNCTGSTTMQLLHCTAI